MTQESVRKALQEFGLPAQPESREKIRALLSGQIERKTERPDWLLVNLLCQQLFSLGNLEDVLLISRAKQIDFDTFCGVEVELLFGAGFEETKAFLSKNDSDDAREALEYICKGNPDDDWSPAKHLAFYRDFYRLKD